MKKIILYILVFLISVKNSTVFAQVDSAAPKTYRVGIFAALYFDSVFNGNQYKYADQMPKVLMPGIEFVEGVQIALDSIKTPHSLKVFVYDYKSKSQNISILAANNILDSLDLIIASAGSAEFKLLADIALKKSIPFISATYPNDGGISANPFVIILNSTLNTHCAAIYNYILKTAPTSKLVLFRKNGIVEDRIAGQFSKLNMGNTGKALLNIPAVMLNDSFNKAVIENQLDSTKMNTIITGTLDENYGKRLALICAELSKEYPITLIGMPNWDGLKDFAKPEFKNFPIYYPATYYNPETDKWSNTVKTVFRERTNGTAMDMVYKGFECTYYFLNILLKGKENFIANINDKSYRVFTEYDIKPVKLKSSSVSPDYFENKKVYILKKVNGVISKAN